MRETFLYFEEMEAILKKRHTIYPKVLAGNGCSMGKKNTYCVRINDDNDSLNTGKEQQEAESSNTE